MKLSIVVKQHEERTITLDNIRSYYFDKAYLVITTSDAKKHWYKTNTVLSITEL